MATKALLAGIKNAVAAVTLGMVLLTGTGCSYDNPAETAKITPATNGINTVVGPMKLADMLILAEGGDQPGRIIGTVFNTSSKDAIVTISGASGSQVAIPVKANGNISLAEPPALILDPAAGSPGSMVTVRVSEDATGASDDVQFPVLDSTLPEYQSYMPATPGPGTTSGTPSSTQSAGTASPGPPEISPSPASPSR